MAGWWNSQYWGDQYWGDQYWGTESDSTGYDQLFDAEVHLYSLTTQEYLPASVIPALHTQVGNVRLLLFVNAQQEYVAPLADTYGQNGNVTITLRGGAFQQWVGGSLPGDVLHLADVSINLLPNGIQQFIPLNLVLEHLEYLDEIRSLYYESPTLVTVDFSETLAEVERITLTVSSDAPEWVELIGGDGGLVGVALYGVSGSERRSIASVSYTNPEVVLYPDETGPFSWLAPRLVAGAVQFELGAYEGFPTRSIPLMLLAPGALSVKVLQQ